MIKQTRTLQKASFCESSTAKHWRVGPPSFPQASEAWYVRDDYIVGEGKKGRCYLIYDGNRDIADFELKFSYRFPGEGNSGVNIRAVKDPTGKRDYQAYHVDLGHAGIGGKVLGAWDFHTPGRIEHRCFRGDKLIIREDDSPAISSLKGAVQVEGHQEKRLEYCSCDRSRKPISILHQWETCCTI